MVARVIINSNTLSTDRLYDYLVPSCLDEELKVGMRVKVPFGRGNKFQEAYVYEIVQKSECEELKSISDIVSNKVYFGKKEVDLMEFMRHRYFCSYMSAIRSFVPAGVNVKYVNYISLSPMADLSEIEKYCQKSSVGAKIIKCIQIYGAMSEEDLKLETGKTSIKTTLNKLIGKGFILVEQREHENVKDTYKTYVELSIDRQDAYSLIDTISKRAPARARVLEILSENYDVELSELLVYAETSKSTVDALFEKGIVNYRSVVCNDSNISYDSSYTKEKPALTKRQTEVVEEISDAISSNAKSAFLIHGVTGSGKTEVYLSIMEKAIEQGKCAIMLVPEISLTPQMISQIFSRFGDDVAVLHSKLTVKQRFIQWNRIKNNEVRIAVGARSAIFAPFDSVGLIIVDEEHESTYKSEMSPRYNAIEIARYIVNRDKSTLVLASATPSVDDYYKQERNSYKLLEMPERINKAPLPDVEIADMRKEIEEGNMSIFSKPLKDAIKGALDKREQIILFLNRRGFSGFVSCRNCGFVMKCPNCNVSLTYHKTVNKMVCHYCDYKTGLKTRCPSCDSNHIRFFGIGTERVVDEVHKLYPKAKVIRMDADTTSGRMGHENILSTFKKGDADILVGTQMITKGLDFENVTLVGIVAADMSLNMDDYKACERTFDLITQVIGRAGRAHKRGRAIIQTYNPDDETIIYSANQDYKGFYEQEIQIRQMLGYPPFTEFIKIQFSGASDKETKQTAKEFHKRVVDSMSDESHNITIYGVCESPLFKINNKYRYRFLIKTPYNKKIYNKLHIIYDESINKYNDVSISVDVNPVNTY